MLTLVVFIPARQKCENAWRGIAGLITIVRAFYHTFHGKRTIPLYYRDRYLCPMVKCSNIQMLSYFFRCQCYNVYGASGVHLGSLYQILQMFQWIRKRGETA